MAEPPQTTEPAILLQWGIKVCGVNMKLCPASLGGNCCPNNYDCTSRGCYSTEQHRDCIRIINIPLLLSERPTPVSSSVGFGCCPDGLLLSIGASVPSGLGSLDGRTNDNSDSQAAESTPTSVPKYAPSSGDDGNDETLSTTQLGGIIGGAIALLALVIAAACVMIRHIDRLAAQMSRNSKSSRSRTATKQTSLQRDVVSPTANNDASPRQLSSPSPLSVASSELEASSLAQELAGTSNAATLAADSLIHNAQDIPPTDLPKVATRPPLAFQWMRSIGLLRASEITDPDDYRIEEESHGFYGSSDHVAGRTGLGIGYTEMRGGRPGHYFCPAAKRT
ncbi:hypothetical protein MKX07_008810 [Trichoderma sp. CBMAI-0711]|nr:hypothetical protein MKX07_008810 [Trichoderma sp. CBMAI-0711]